MGSGLLTPWHLLILAVVVLLVFGPKRLPELGRSLGSGMRGFKRAIEGDDEGVEAGDEAAGHPAADERARHSP
ncbi:MAG: twin-arginine translocase TatA/TatE family subunit [Actinobacteria bacterium]|nr:MAG: twin-arginine translocase TatA/TatE family subunit [Actinomycetota bacterium]